MRMHTHTAKGLTNKTIVVNEARYHIYKNLDELNKLSAESAGSVFRDCCGSTEWARQMASERPFLTVEDLYNAAEKKWMSLSPADWLEAFAAHPKIGSSKPAASQNTGSAEWSRDEQSGVNTAADDVLSELENVNRLYLERFGFIFIVSATGKTADEMLAICKARLNNSIETELDLAAIEQSKITAIRLNKLLEK